MKATKVLFNVLKVSALTVCSTRARDQAVGLD